MKLTFNLKRLKSHSKASFCRSSASISCEKSFKVYIFSRRQTPDRNIVLKGKPQGVSCLQLSFSNSILHSASVKDTLSCPLQRLRIHIVNLKTVKFTQVSFQRKRLELLSNLSVFCLHFNLNLRLVDS